MRTTLGMTLALAGVLLPGAPSPAAPAGDLAVLGARVRFPRDAADGARVVLAGDLLAGPGLASFDPRTDPFRVAVGPLVLLDGPPWEGVPRYRETRTGWRFEVRGAYGGDGRVSVRLDPLNGRFTVTARGVDAGALLAAGPGGVLVELTAGEEIYGATVDFTAKGAAQWVHVGVPPPRPPPGGGGGGGPGPLPGSGLVTIAQGAATGITGFRWEVVKDAAAWAQLWQEHAGSGSPPAVDFSREMVLGLWLGVKPTGGYTVSIRKMTAPYMVMTGGWCPPCIDPQMCPGAPCFGGVLTPGALVEAEEIQPGPRCVVTAGVTFPFHIVRAPRVDGPVVLSLVTKVVDCP